MAYCNDNAIWTASCDGLQQEVDECDSDNNNNQQQQDEGHG